MGLASEIKSHSRPSRDSKQLGTSVRRNWDEDRDSHTRVGNLVGVIRDLLGKKEMRHCMLQDPQAAYSQEKNSCSIGFLVGSGV